MKIITVIALVFGFCGSSLLDAAPEADQTLQGHKGKWTLHWRGKGSDQVSSNAPLSLVSQALDAAKGGDREAFLRCFYIDQKNPPVSVVALYDRWTVISRHYSFLFCTEAEFIGENASSLRAVSVSPSVRKRPKQDIPSLPPLDAEVVFLQKVGTEWKMSATVHDPILQQHLSKRDSGWVSRAENYIFTSDDQAREALNRDRKERQKWEIENLQKKGSRLEDVNAFKQRHELENRGVKISSWEDWKKHYKAKIIDPPMIFDQRQKFQLDNSNLIAAYRSYRSALCRGDAQMLLDMADESGTAWLKNHLGVDLARPKATYALITNMTLSTVLLTANDTFDGNKYALVLARNQEHTNPKEGQVSFDVVIFRETKSGFLLSRDLDIVSPFGRVTIAARANGANLLHYPQFYEKVKNSEFPPHFYTIQE